MTGRTPLETIDILRQIAPGVGVGTAEDGIMDELQVGRRAARGRLRELQRLGLISMDTRHENRVVITERGAAVLTAYKAERDMLTAAGWLVAPAALSRLCAWCDGVSKVAGVLGATGAHPVTDAVAVTTRVNPPGEAAPAELMFMGLDGSTVTFDDKMVRGLPVRLRQALAKFFYNERSQTEQVVADEEDQ